jgi:hypothetical protein
MKHPEALHPALVILREYLELISFTNIKAGKPRSKTTQTGRDIY